MSLIRSASHAARHRRAHRVFGRTGRLKGRSLIYLALAGICPWLASPACADGGAHVVDSANVETPGVCHLESWATIFEAGHGLLNLSPACTFESWPALEVGASLQHTQDHTDAMAAGPAIKLNVRSSDTGMGIGIIANAALDLKTGRPETAALIVPVSLPVGDRLLINLNGGWTYAAGRAHHSQLFYGAQAQAIIARDLSAMMEIFGDSRELPGAQAGLRWTPKGGRLDIDLLAGHRVDGNDARAITLGITVRR